MTELQRLPAPYRDLVTVYPFDDFGWFDEPKQATLQRLIEKHDVRDMVELGSFLGKSTRWFARTIPSGGQVHAVDHWEGNREHQAPERSDVYPRLASLYERFLSNVVHAGLCDSIVPYRMNSRSAADQLDVIPDLVFVDASHEFDDVLVDLASWYPRLRPGGVLCGDDWTWGETRPVARAVETFARDHDLEVQVQGKIWWILR